MEDHIISCTSYKCCEVIKTLNRYHIEAWMIRSFQKILTPTECSAGKVLNLLNYIKY